MLVSFHVLKFFCKEQRFVFISAVDLGKKTHKKVYFQTSNEPHTNRVSSYSFAVAAPSGRVLFACSGMKLCMYIKNRHIVWPHSMICTICVLFVLSENQNTHLFQANRRGKKWVMFYHRATKVGTRLFLQKQVMEWLNLSKL